MEISWTHEYIQLCQNLTSCNNNFFLNTGERWQYVKVSSTWEDSGEITYDMGSVGYIYSGAVYFDARSSTDGDSAIYNEGDSLDPYYGHSNDASQYHYHAVST